MFKKTQIFIVEQNFTFSLDELVQATHSDQTLIIEMVEHGLLKPTGHSPEEWEFDEQCFKTAISAARLWKDLEINMQGVALALDLLRKIEILENELKILRSF